MSTALPRGAITTNLVTALGTQPFPVGDGEPPIDPHGWQGEPNATGTNFVPWVVLVAGNATVSSGSLGASQSEWRAIYYLTTAGVTRKQAEGVADTARDLLVSYRASVVAALSTWAIQQIRVTSIGGVSRIGQTSPSYYVQTDTLEVWLSKELT